MNRGWAASAIPAVMAVLTVGCAPTAQAATPDGLHVTVTRVVDGDTIHAVDDRGAVLKIRALGVDSPESVDPRKPVECGAPEASAFAKRMLLGQPVMLVTDPTQDTVDRYKRVLAYVRLGDGRDYSVEAARAGMARSYIYNRKPVAEHAVIAAAEAEARAAHRGMWGCPA